MTHPTPDSGDTAQSIHTEILLRHLAPLPQFASLDQEQVWVLDFQGRVHHFTCRYQVLRTGGVTREPNLIPRHTLTNAALQRIASNSTCECLPAIYPELARWVSTHTGVVHAMTRLLCDDYEIQELGDTLFRHLTLPLVSSLKAEALELWESHRLRHHQVIAESRNLAPRMVLSELTQHNAELYLMHLPGRPDILPLVGEVRLISHEFLAIALTQDFVATRAPGTFHPIGPHDTTPELVNFLLDTIQEELPPTEPLTAGLFQPLNRAAHAALLPAK